MRANKSPEATIAAISSFDSADAGLPFSSLFLGGFEGVLSSSFEFAVEGILDGPASSTKLLVRDGEAVRRTQSKVVVRGGPVEAASGEEIWTKRIPAPGNSVPMSFRLREDSKQFIVLAAGGTPLSKRGYHLIAYTLR